MPDQTSPIHDVGRSSGSLNYLDNSVESSLFRNGKVLMPRNPDGSDGVMQGVDSKKRTVPIRNGRALSGGQGLTVAANGFELLTRPLAPARPDFLDHRQVVQDYYPQCARIVGEALGARAFAFDHNLRSARNSKADRDSRKRAADGQAVQEPVHFVHGDYTLTSAPQRLRDLARPPGGNDTLRSFLKGGESLISNEMVEQALGDGGRFAIINLWRNIASEPVATHPLALCDGRSVEPEDLVVFEIHYRDRIGENYFAKYADRHRWYYFPEMTGDEALLIKQWDSAGPLARSGGKLGDAADPHAPCTFSFHSAFEDPAARPDAPDRRSIEVRCIVIYDT